MINKKESKATGGGPNKMVNFSALEESTIAMLSLDRIVNCPGKVFGLVEEGNLSTNQTLEASAVLDENEEQGSRPATNHTETASASVVNSSSLQDVSPSSPPEYSADGIPQVEAIVHRETRRQSKASKDDFKKTLLEAQTEDLKAIRKSVGEIATYTRRMFYLKEKHIKFQMQTAKRRDELKQEKLKFQLEMLEFKKLKLDLDKKK